jgi:L-threonylcarbamoyladenylate synthase
MSEVFEIDIIRSLEVLKAGGVILYPTDTIWGLGCDATNVSAVKRIYEIKQRADSKSMIILVAEERHVLQYTAAPDLAVFDFIEQQSRPTTVIYEHAVGLADNVIADDGSVAIRIVRDEFCRHLVKRFRKPIVSTSANISGMASPKIFAEISDQIKSSVDYVVQWRQDDEKLSEPSQIVRWINGSVEYLRK